MFSWRKFWIGFFDNAYFFSKYLSIVFRALIAVVVLYVIGSVNQSLDSFTAWALIVCSVAYIFLPFFALVRDSLYRDSDLLERD